MADSTRTPFELPDPDAVARTERFIDALATGGPVAFDDVGDRGDPDDRALAGLLEDWRYQLRLPAASALCLEPDAVAALNRGLAGRRRSRRGLALVGSVAATVLGIGGFAAVVGGAQPGDALYGVHTMLFGEASSAHDDRITLSAKIDLDLVQQMITQGQWDQAQDKLAAVSGNVQTVNDSGRKQELIEQVNLLTAKVATRDRNATALPGSLPNPGGASVTAPATEPAVDGGSEPVSPPPSAPGPASSTPVDAWSDAPGTPTQQPNPGGG